MIFPIHTDTPIRRTPWVNCSLIAVNVLLHLALPPQTAPGPESRAEQIRNVFVLNGGDPQLYQFITYQFLHANFAHLIGNMLFLWVFGNPVNAKMGHGSYVMFYLAGGVFAATGF